MFKGPLYRVLSPSLYMSHLWWKGWRLWKQNMSFSSSSPEEISLELRQKQRWYWILVGGYMVFLLTWSGWKLCLWGRLSWQRHLPAVCLSCFQPAVWCSAVVLISQLANALLHHLPHTQNLYLGRRIIYTMQSWDGFLSSHWPACGKVSEVSKENTVLWTQMKEEVDSCPEVL